MSINFISTGLIEMDFRGLYLKDWNPNGYNMLFGQKSEKLEHQIDQLELEDMYINGNLSCSALMLYHYSASR